MIRTQIFSGRHISVNWTIMGHSSLCYLMGGIDLVGGRRLGPKSWNPVTEGLTKKLPSYNTESE